MPPVLEEGKVNVGHIRYALASKFGNKDFVIDRGNRLVEILGCTFVASEPSIFGKIDFDYVDRELEWYLSKSLNVADIPGKTPKIWEMVSSSNGEINSNYGYLVYGEKNGLQYWHALQALLDHRETRRSEIIYQRPSMHEEYNRDGMSDFICTNAVVYHIRNGKLHATVQMRSNDAWAGYRNDYAWQKYVLDQLVLDYNTLSSDSDKIEAGSIYWNAASLHVYQRQFYLLEHYLETGIWNVTKKEFDEYEASKPEPVK